ncbi:MAG: MFS transporter [Rhodocyclaceae bacterium]|nr:MFS transporter [Rhodocyclaceae bacterium]
MNQSQSSPELRLLLIGRGLRAFVDGYVAILLPVYLLALGYNVLDVGLISTSTLLGSAALTLAVGAWGHHFNSRRLLLSAAILMTATGLAFISVDSFWPLLLIAFVGTLNPSAGDVSVFLPLEHARIAGATTDATRTTAFARYSLTGSLCAALGALAVGVPELLETTGIRHLDALRCMFVFYAMTGFVVYVMYRKLPVPQAEAEVVRPAPLRESRTVVVRIAALFCVDAFAGGLVVNSLLALWLFGKYDLSLSVAGSFFFWSGLLGAFSQLAAPKVAEKIGLLNTMVFTHIPANIFLILAALSPNLTAAFVFLLLRALLSQMDVPTRSAYVMSVVTPAERNAAASFTATPRSLAAALGPTLGTAMFAAGFLAAPLVVAGGLKIAYDLALWRSFRNHQIDSQAPGN